MTAGTRALETATGGSNSFKMRWLVCLPTEDRQLLKEHLPFESHLFPDIWLVDHFEILRGVKRTRESDSSGEGYWGTPVERGAAYTGHSLQYASGPSSPSSGSEQGSLPALFPPYEAHAW